MGEDSLTSLSFKKEVNMVHNYLRKIIRKNTRAPLLISLLFILIFLAGSIRESHKWSTLFTPLAEESSIDGIQSLQKQGKYYFQLKNAHVMILDYAIYSYETVNGVKTGDEKLSQVYGILAYDDGCLLTLLPKDYLNMSDEELDSVTAVASLENLNDSEYHRDAYNEMVSYISNTYQVDSSVVEKNVPEVCVTIPEDGRFGDQMFSAILILGFVISLVSFLYQLLILFNYKLSRFYKKLARAGSAEDIEYSINRAAEDGTYIYMSTLRSASYTGLITPNYVIGKKNSSLMLGNTKDLVWVHLKLIRHKAYFVTVRKSYQVLFYFKDVKAPVTINCNKKETAAILLEAVIKGLGVYCEYSEELAKLYKKNYDAFLREIESRAAAAKRQAEYDQEESNESVNYPTGGSGAEYSGSNDNSGKSDF